MLSFLACTHTSFISVCIAQITNMYHQITATDFPNEVFGSVEGRLLQFQHLPTIIILTMT